MSRYVEYVKIRLFLQNVVSANGVRLKKTPWFLSLDIDECSADPSQCDVNANCINNDGSYLCTCLQGFTGNGTICEGMS